jgi:ABC-type lipoprotein release transport system permease subunit
VLVKVAWRNIWRSRMRSTVVMLSIALGLWAGVFSMGLFMGMSDQRTSSALDTYISHVQIHAPDYKFDPDPQHDIADVAMVTAVLDTAANVAAYSPRLIVGGMASSPITASGVGIYGIQPKREREVTDVWEQLIAGSYLEAQFRNPVLIGQKLAEKLKVRLRSKIVLTVQDVNGDLTAGAFRVAGIYKTNSSTFDEATVFVPRDALAVLYGRDSAQEIALRLTSVRQSVPVRDALQVRFPDLLVEDWARVSPELGFADSVLEQSLYIFVLVILLAMAFGIVNSMLMAVLERRHELGMLLCIGMSRARVFGMIAWETVFVALIGGPAGLLLAFLSFAWFGKRGIDLSIVGQGLASLGMDTVIYPHLAPKYYLNITIMVLATALLSAIYPAVKAIRYRPAEAVRAY